EGGGGGEPVGGWCEAGEDQPLIRLPEDFLPSGNAPREHPLDVGQGTVEHGRDDARGGDDQPESNDLHVVKLPTRSLGKRAPAANGALRAGSGRVIRRAVR